MITAGICAVLAGLIYLAYKQGVFSKLFVKATSVPVATPTPTGATGPTGAS